MDGDGILRDLTCGEYLGWWSRYEGRLREMEDNGGSLWVGADICFVVWDIGVLRRVWSVLAICNSMVKE